MNEAERMKSSPKNVMSDMVAAPRRVSVAKNNKKRERGSFSRKEKPVKKLTENEQVVKKDSYHDEVRIASLTSNRSTLDSDGKKIGCALWLVILIAILSLTLVVGGLFSRAKIVLTPVSVQGSVDTILTLTQGAVATSKNIPFYTAKKVFSKTDVVPAEKGQSKDGFATGTVRFFNATSKSVTVPAGAKVIIADRGSFIYTVKSTTVIPPGTSSKPGQKDGVVVAESVGAAYNTSSGHDVLLLSPVEGVHVRSVGVFSGGSTKDDLLADPVMLSNAVTNLKSEALVSDETFKLLAAEAPDDFYVLPMMITDSDRSVTYDYNQDDGVHVTVSQALLAVMVKKVDLAKYLSSSIKAPEGALMMFDENHSSVQVLTSAAISPSQVPNTLSVRLVGDVSLVGVIKGDDIVSHLKGIGRAEAKSYLGSLAEIKTADIHIMPFWRRILPLDDEEITITLIKP